MKSLFLIAFLLNTGLVYAQKHGQDRIDSLLQELPKAKEDTNKVKLLCDVSFALYTVTPPEGLRYGKQAQTMAQKLDWKKGMAMAEKAMGANYLTQGDYAKALDYFFNAMKMSEALGDKNGIAANAGNIGNVYERQGDYAKALEHYFKALKMYEALGDKSRIALNTGNIGVLYADQGDYAKALEYDFKALKMNEALGDKSRIALNTGNIGLVYNYQSDYAKALEYYFKALNIYEALGDKDGIAVNTINIGMVYNDQGDYPKALEYDFKALKMEEELGDKYGIAGTTCNIGMVYLRQGKLKEAEQYLEDARKVAEAVGALEYLKIINGEFSDLYIIKQDYPKALSFYKDYITVRDSIYNEENTQKLTRAEMQYEFDKKQLADSLQNAQARVLAAEKLDKQKTYTAMGAGLAVLLLGFSGLIFRNNKKLSAEKEKSEHLLHNILPEEVSNELKARGATTAKEFDAVTVLFTDFVNFTSAGERMNPKELVEELHHCFKAFDEIIEKYQIEKIKTVGDAYLAVSGLPEANPSHAQNIVKAALEIRDFMLERRKQSGDKTFEIRIGIHSGSVVAGIVGVKKFAYDIWGDTVNTAARMEQNGEAGKVNISETTHELVKDAFGCTYRGEIEAKNKGKMKMYFVSEK